MVTKILENGDNLLEFEIMFLQNKAPPHFDVRVSQFLLVRSHR